MNISVPVSHQPKKIPHPSARLRVFGLLVGWWAGNSKQPEAETGSELYVRMYVDSRHNEMWSTCGPVEIAPKAHCIMRIPLLFSTPTPIEQLPLTFPFDSRPVAEIIYRRLGPGSKVKIFEINNCRPSIPVDVVDL